MIKTSHPIYTQDDEKAYTKITTTDEIKSSYSIYLSDESRFGTGWCDGVLFPYTEGHVCEILRDMSIQKTPVTVSGARTGIVGGAVPFGGAVLNTERMDHYLDLVRDESGCWSIWVQPGVRLSDIYEHIDNKNIPLQKEKIAPFQADTNNYFYPPDPTEDSALIGSTVATDASGARSLKYGATRGFVKGLRVALSNGEILHLERGKSMLSSDGLFHIRLLNGKTIAFAPPGYHTPALKSACGLFSQPKMDLIDLFIGSEGILGVITAVNLALLPKPKNILSGLSFFEDEMAGILFSIEARSILSPLSLEYFDSRSLDLIRLDQSSSFKFNIPYCSKAACFWEIGYDEDEEIDNLFILCEKVLGDYGSSLDATWAGMERDSLKKLKAFRHRVPELINNIIARRKSKDANLHKISTDMAVPDSEFLSLVKGQKGTLDRLGIEYVIFGHIGDNHLHINLLPRDLQELQRAKDTVKAIAREVVSKGGVVSAEHGIGKLKHDLLLIQYGAEGIKEMARVKKALDPDLILGRGNIIPVEFLKNL